MYYQSFVISQHDSTPKTARLFVTWSQAKVCYKKKRIRDCMKVCRLLRLVRGREGNITHDIELFRNSSNNKINHVLQPRNICNRRDCASVDVTCFLIYFFLQVCSVLVLTLRCFLMSLLAGNNTRFYHINLFNLQGCSSLSPEVQSQFLSRSSSSVQCCKVDHHGRSCI